MFYFLEEMSKVLQSEGEQLRQQLLDKYKSENKKRGPFIKRTFKPASPDEQGSKDGKETNLEDKDHVFRVVQWNTLADALAASTPETNFNKVPPEYLEWPLRKARIFEHLLDLNGDLIGLQEVDHFFDTFEPIFQKLGYFGIFHPKKASPCLRNPLNNGPDGVALFYRLSRYSCTKVAAYYLLDNEGKESNQPIIVCALQDKKSLEHIIVGVTHYKAKPPFQDLRTAQATDTLKKIKDMIGEIGVEDCSVILCGDFNGECDEPFYQILTNSTHPLIASAFKEATKQEIGYTTWKMRESVEVRHTIDFIWLTTKSIKVISYLDLPKETDVPSHRFPTVSHPSDHISLCFDLKFHKS